MIHCFFCHLCNSEVVVNREVSKAYQRALRILQKKGCSLLFDYPPIQYETLPLSAYDKIGIGAATGLWKGMHSNNLEDCPFEEDWPIYAFWKAGFEFQQLMRSRGIIV